MIFQVDKTTGQRLSADMTLEQAKNLPVLNYIDLDVAEDATKEEKEFVARYRLQNDNDLLLMDKSEDQKKLSDIQKSLDSKTKSIVKKKS